ncbi:CO/xanthine dehydrogenase Mo-binding subunit [Haloactinopolyspora alba]|uniref:CO/xanthine dehydrogenase Mo-binding subunit n=1 Tax=Haloactinopolyspora alba TaxID=648780 RepID=A0A2P8DVT0_9ACTN|nr:xanthine dehydrogenase family protein molybdopterin-binding subunit [Haloactinopolyspora alba]PSL01277.1 CO/xanthine dehydrogenase Mo-binding subunit [Haloactinopolyspora alba]
MTRETTQGTSRAPAHTGVVGRSLPADDAAAIVAGDLEYVTDRRVDGMLHGAVHRSAHPHARIVSVDTARAASEPGVVAVLTAGDVPCNQLGTDSENGAVLAGDVVRQVGEAIALVAAADPETARRAADLIEVGYEPLPVVDGPDSPAPVTVHPRGNVAGTLTFESGDVATALSSSDLVVDVDTTTSAQEHVAIETPGGMAEWDLGKITVWCGSQNPGLHRKLVAHALRLNLDDVRLVSNPVGGAFGSRNDDPAPVYLALLAWHTTRPVHLHLSRRETIVAGPKRHPYRTRVRLGFDRAGTLRAIDSRAVADTGPYVTAGRNVLKTSAELSSGPYAAPNARFDGTVAYSNNANAGAFRGFGAPQVAFALETAVSEAAVELGLDPVQIRRANLTRPGDAHSLYGHTVSRSLRASQTLDAAAAHPWWRDRDAWAAGSAGPWRRGTGIAMAIKGVGMGSGKGDTARARLIVSATGTVNIWAGPNHTGQAIGTAYRQIAADTLGIDHDRIRVHVGDSELVPESGATAASRSMYAGGSAVHQVCGRLRAVLDEPGVDTGASFDDVAAHLVASGRAEYEAEFVLPDVDDIGRIPPEALADYAPHAVYGCSAQVVRLEVNTLTGEIRLHGVVCAVDAGVAVNPGATVGQAEGGVAQGVGFALFEEYRLDAGVPVTTSLENYLIPTAMDVPPIETVLVTGHENTGPFGAKGMSEVVVVPTAPAIAAAVGSATGFWPRHLPMTPERVRAGLSAMSGEGTSERSGRRSAAERARTRARPENMSAEPAEGAS